MILPNIKILVIDDKYDDVKKLLNLLNKNGLSYNYYKGDDLNKLPVNPLKNIRILFLDFVLGTDGQPDKNKISVLMNVLNSTLSPYNGPYIIAAWTLHEELLNLFNEAIAKDKSLPKPMAIINLDKQDCMKSLNKIEINIKKKINDKEILEILMNWESNANIAAGNVLKMLSELSRPVNQQQSFDDYMSMWNSELEKYIYWIAKSYLGKRIKQDNNLLKASLCLFTEIFRDNIENIIKKNTYRYRNLLNRIYSNSNRKLPPRDKAILNTKFSIVTDDRDNKLQPGNIYNFSDFKKEMECNKNECYFNIIKITKKIIFKEICSNINNKTDKERFLKDTKLILIEITPECDYVQKNWKNAKMLLGFLLPEKVNNKQTDSKIKKSDFIYKPLPIFYHNKTFYITFNSRYTFNINLNSSFSNISPLFKARKEFLVDIQHWYSRYISRPGKIEFM